MVEGASRASQISLPFGEGWGAGRFKVDDVLVEGMSRVPMMQAPFVYRQRIQSSLGHMRASVDQFRMRQL
eukprot:4776787-Alexandrium_andersonii.AAC.1